MSLLKVEVASLGGVERVSLEGELDRSVAEQLELALLTSAGRPVVIDLTDCEFIDSSGIAQIVEHWRASDGQLALAGAGSQTARVLETAGVVDGIETFETFEDAFAAWNGRKQRAFRSSMNTT
jgi:anti-sigma B factor antagonist